jgi:ribonuclease HII
MIGVDEVGRGSWAGPLVVCAVRLLDNVAELADSKKLTKKKREILYDLIVPVADIGIGWVSADEIDDLGLSAALKLAAAKALVEVSPTDNERVIVDGTISFFPNLPGEQTIIKADASVPCVSAASIVAKVARDRRMAELGKMYPQYNFADNVGYGTAVHKAAIEQYGLLRLHRHSFALPEQTSAKV